MRIKSIIAAGVGLAFCALAAGAAAQRGDVLGDWRAQHTGAGGGVQTCDIGLTAQDWFGAWKATSFACSGDLFGIDRYRIEGDAVVLIGMGSQVKARLRMRGDRLVGTDAQGRDVTLTRKGAPPSLPPRGGDRGPRGEAPGGGSNTGGWNGGGCVRHGDSERCATGADMAPPQVRLVTTYNLRTQADADSSPVNPLRKGTCAAVVECRNQGPDLWCKVQAEGPAGWVPQVTRRDGQKVLVFTGGC